MITPTRYRTLVRASAIYDLVATAGFVTPWSFAITMGTIESFGHVLGVTSVFPVFDATQTLFANLMGSVVVVWSLARLHTPTQIMGRLDALARCLFAMWQIFAVARGAPMIILAFTAVEILFGVAQALPIRQTRTTSAACQNAAHQLPGDATDQSCG